MTDKQRIAPNLEQYRAAWGMGMTYCSWCHTFVSMEEAHRQVGSPNTVWCCRECIAEMDSRERRPAPEAVIELRRTALPPRLGALFSMMEESEDD